MGICGEHGKVKPQDMYKSKVRKKKKVNDVADEEEETRYWLLIEVAK